MWYTTGPPRALPVGVYDHPPPEGVGGIDAVQLSPGWGAFRLLERASRIRDQLNAYLP